MKYFVLCCALLILWTPSSQAQGVSAAFGIQGDLLNFNVGNVGNTTTSVSAGNVTSDLKDVYGLGYGGGIHFDIKLVLVSFRISADYVTISPSKDKYQSLLKKYIGNFASAVNIDGGRIDIYAATASLKLPILPLPVISVYVTGGGGLVRLNVASTTVTFNGVPVSSFPAVEPQTKPAANAGAGVDISLGKLALFGELKIDWIFTDPNTSTAIPYATIGLTF